MNLLDLYAKISLDTSEYDSGVEKVSKSGSSLGSKLKSGLATAGNIAAKGIGLIAGAATAAGGALLALEASTEEYRIAQGKLNTAFDAAGYSAETASQAYNAFYGILGDTDTATEASQLLAKLADSEKDVTTWTNIAAGVSGTFGDSLPIEGLIEASNETAKVGQVTGVLADALNWAGISEDDFNAKLAECTSESERNQLIMDTLSGTYDEASDAFYRNNEALVASRENQAALDASLAKLGDAVATVKNKVVSLFLPAISDAADAISGFVGNIDVAGITDRISNFVGVMVDGFSQAANFVASTFAPVLESLKGLFASVASAVSPITSALSAYVSSGQAATDATNAAKTAVSALASALTFILDAASAFVTWLSEGSAGAEAFKAAIVAAAAGLATWKIVSTISTLMSSFTTIMTTLTTVVAGAKTAFAALNAVVSANPFGAVVTVVSSLVAGLMYLWTTNEGFRDAIIGIWNAIVAAFTAAGQAIQDAWNAVVAFFSSLWDNIQTAATAAASAISSAFTAAWNAIQSAWSGVVSFFSNVWEGIKAVFAVVASVLINYFSNAWQGIQAVWSAATGFFENVWNTIKGIFSVVAAVLSGNFSDAWNAIQNVLSGWGSYFQGLWNQIVSIFSNALSTFADIGRNIVTGIWNGISGMASWLWGKVTGFFSGIVDGVKGLLGIRSPSRVFASIGQYMAEGVGQGWDQQFSSIRDGIENDLDFGNVKASVNTEATSDEDKSNAFSDLLVLAQDKLMQYAQLFETYQDLGSNYVIEGLQSLRQRANSEANKMIVEARQIYTTGGKNIGLAFANAVAEGLLSGTGRTVNAAVQMATQVLNATKETLGVDSYSSAVASSYQTYSASPTTYRTTEITLVLA